jgi:hypothetical protein
MLLAAAHPDIQYGTGVMRLAERLYRSNLNVFTDQILDV